MVSVYIDVGGITAVLTECHAKHYLRPNHLATTWFVTAEADLVTTLSQLEQSKDCRGATTKQSLVAVNSSYHSSYHDVMPDDRAISADLA